MRTLNTVYVVDIGISQTGDTKNKQGYIQINERNKENKTGALPWGLLLKLGQFWARAKQDVSILGAVMASLPRKSSVMSVISCIN